MLCLKNWFTPVSISNAIARKKSPEVLTLSFLGSFPLVGASVPWNDAADSTKSDGGCEKLRDLPVVVCLTRDTAGVCALDQWFSTSLTLIL